MKYMGSKARIAKHILPIILKDRKPGQYYVEPFVGGANCIDKVDGNRIGSDNNRYLIEMWRWLMAFGQPDFDQSKPHYDQVRMDYNAGGFRMFSDAYIGYVGFMASANGRFFDGGYSGISKTKTGKERNYIDESIRGLAKQIPNMVGVQFFCCDYEYLTIPDNSLIYCDIPYKGTKQYSTSKNFDHDRFWGWCREKSRQGHKVFVSEYEAPADFVCVWEQEVKSSLSANGVCGGSKTSVERLFTLESKDG